MCRSVEKRRAGCCDIKVGAPKRSTCRRSRRDRAPPSSPRLKCKSSSSGMNIGIDLGTTNSALAYVAQASGSAELPDYPEIKVLEIPQYVAPAQVEPRRTLPSFLFLGDQTYIGAYAREQGALVPTKSVHSAKSWLSNPEVDRTAKILPWDAQEAGRVLSPVEVSNAVLAQIRDAWNQTHPGNPLAEQEIVLTVPASFDEEARELTVQAAHEAGM